IGGLRDGDLTTADGLSEDRQWLRIAYQGRPAWLSRSVVEENAAIESLPILTNDLKTPMQAFYLQTGLGQPPCADSPDNILLVQGPDNLEINITVNEIDIRLGSSGALRTVVIDDKPYLEVTVFDGHFALEDVNVTTGQRSLVELDCDTDCG